MNLLAANRMLVQLGVGVLWVFLGAGCQGPLPAGGKELLGGEHPSNMWRIMRQDRFVYPGPVEWRDGLLSLGPGQPGTGLVYQGGDLPRDRYELRWQARRVEGFDFFCGLTFPVGDQFLTLVMGGWDGTITGLSCINGGDASENETTQSIDYLQQRWYDVRLRVALPEVQVWLDHEALFLINVEGKDLSLHPAMNSMRPLSLASWSTGAEIRDLRLIPLEPPNRPNRAGEDQTGNRQ